MGKTKFSPNRDHSKLNMKIFATLAAAAAAQQAGTPVNPLMPAMPAMPAMPGLGGMNPLMMSLLLGDDKTFGDDPLMMMMLMGGMNGQGMGGMNPLMLSLLLDDGKRTYDKAALQKICDDAKNACDTGDVDMKNIFSDLIAGTEKDCAAEADEAACTATKEKTYDAIQKLKKSDMSDLLLLSMMGGQGMGDMNSMLPLLLLQDDNKSDNKNLMLMMMMQGGNMGAMNPMLMLSLLD